MYRVIITCSVECYWHCSDDTVPIWQNSEFFSSFRCATTTPITVFINVVFLHLSLINATIWN